MRSAVYHLIVFALTSRKNGLGGSKDDAVNGCTLSRETLSVGDCKPVMLKPSCIATETRYNMTRTSDSLNAILPIKMGRQKVSKKLIFYLW